MSATYMFKIRTKDDEKIKLKNIRTYTLRLEVAESHNQQYQQQKHHQHVNHSKPKRKTQFTIA